MKKIVSLYSPHSNKALRVANRLFNANREMDEVSSIKWKLTVIDADIVNAAAFPVIKHILKLFPITINLF